MKDFFNNHKKKILIPVALAVLYGIAHLLGVDVKFDTVKNGDISTIGQQIEDAPE